MRVGHEHLTCLLLNVKVKGVTCCYRVAVRMTLTSSLAAGFLKDENRICVALSRARMGLYVVGNFKHLARNSDLWSKMVQRAKDKGAIGDSLRLACQNHPDQAGDSLLTISL